MPGWLSRRLNWLGSSRAYIIHRQFTILSYITISNIYTPVVTSVMRWGPIVCPANREQRKVLGPALENAQFNSPWNQCQQQWASRSSETGLKRLLAKKAWNIRMWCGFDLIFMIWSVLFWHWNDREERTKKFSRGHLVCPPRCPQLDLSCTLQMFAPMSSFSPQTTAETEGWSENTRTKETGGLMHSKSLEHWITMCSDLPHLIFFWALQQQHQSVSRRTSFKDHAAGSVWKHKLGKGIWPGMSIIVDVYIQTLPNSTKISKFKLKNNLAHIITIQKKKKKKVYL